MANVTQIPAPRVELIDPRTGLMSREWFRFFNNLYVLTGGGTTDTSLADLQLAPVYQLTSPDATAADLAPQTVTVAEPQFDLSPRYELGTLASQNADNITFGNLTVTGTATFSAGTANQVQYLNASKVLTGSVNLTFDGTTLTAAGFAGPHNGTVGAGTPNTGAFTTLSASSTVSGTGFSTYLASPPAIGSTAASTGAFTTLSASSTFTLSGGTANGVGYLNGSKVFTTGAALTFDGTNFATTGTASATKFIPTGGSATGNGMYLPSANTLAWSTNGVETLRLTSAGRLGIGTTSPSDVLGISGGGIRIEGWNADATFIQQQFSAGYFQRVAGDSTNRQLRLESNSSDGGTSGSIAFRTSSSGTLSTTMTLDGAGNLGLSTTPSASWGGVGAAFQVGSFIGLNNNVNLGAGDLFYNSIRTASDSYQYLTAGFASRFQQRDGAFKWFSAASGSAGAAITYTQVMLLDASGNLTVPAMYGTTVTTPRNVFIDSAGKMGGISSTRASKANIVPLTDVSWLYDLKPVSFNYRKRDEDGVYLSEFEREKQYGMIAEDTVPIAPDLCVFDDKGKVVGIHYDRMVAPLLKALQDQAARIDALEKKLGYHSR